jgi:SAM-dependent methyltransferase
MVCINREKEFFLKTSFLLNKYGGKVMSLLRKIVEPPVPNYKGDRYIEYSFVGANIPDKPGKLLDFGCGESSIGQSWMGLLAARKGYNVTGFDLEPQNWLYEYPDLKFIQGDILKFNFSPEEFDVIINISVVEHIGLAGNYGIKEADQDGDVSAMRRLKDFLKPGGKMIFSVPVGKDSEFPPWHRVYGEKRLPALLEGWDVAREEYWIKNKSNRWIRVSKQEALADEPRWYKYGLGLFVLQKK